MAFDCADDGEGQALALRCGDAVFFTVARGPVPRDLQRHDVCFLLCSL